MTATRTLVNNVTTTSQALLAALNSGGATEQNTALAALNAAKVEAVTAGLNHHRGIITIVDGKPFSPSTITADRAGEVMANAARANARR